MISVITCWRDHPELIADYESAVRGAEVIIVQNNSVPENQAALYNLSERLGGHHIVPTYDAPFSFSESCNVGLTVARGDIIMMLNNDITAAPGWLAQVERDVRPGALYGPQTQLQIIHGRPLLYVDGWCVAARREVWEHLGGFDAETFKRPYWEDVDLSWRAVQAGYTLHQTRWPVKHLGNTTSRTVAGAYDHSLANRLAFEAKVAACVST